MTSPSSSSAALTVLMFDRSTRLRMQFTGPKAAESLTGLVTNDVLSLRGGDGLYACALTAKGRIISDVRILSVSDEGEEPSLLVDANAASGAGFAAMIRKYVNPRLAKYVDVTDATSCVTVCGASALDLLHTLGASSDAVSAIGSGPAFTHRAVRIVDTHARLVRVPDLGAGDTFDVHCDRADIEDLREALTSAGVDEVSDAEWHRRRVMAGRPEWGIDMDEGTLAQEANMDALSAISYTKGCYTGQETVARVHFRGHVNRTLRRVTYPDGVLPPRGASINGADGALGETRSVAVADAGQTIGLAMLRREVGIGTTLSWQGEDGIGHAVLVTDSADAV